MNTQLLAKWSNLSKVILVILIIICATKNVQANNDNDSLNSSDSCAKAKLQNVEIKLLKTTSDYYMLSVSSGNSLSDNTISFLNGDNDILYSASLPAKQYIKRYAITRTDDFNGLKILINNKACNLSTTYDLSFVRKVTETMLVSKN